MAGEIGDPRAGLEGKWITDVRLNFVRRPGSDL